MDEAITFRCPSGKKQICPLFSITLICLAIWFFFGLKQELRNDDAQKWFFMILYIIGILIIFFVLLKFIIDVFSQLTFTPLYIHYKGPLKNITIQWDEILGAYSFYEGSAFRIIGFNGDIILNVNNFYDVELFELTDAKLSPILDREPPSKSEKVLMDLINQILQTHPNASLHKIVGKLLSVDHKLKFDKIRQLVQSVRETAK